MVVDDLSNGGKGAHQLAVRGYVDGHVLDAQAFCHAKCGRHDFALETLLFLADTQDHGDCFIAEEIGVFGGAEGAEVEKRQDGLGFTTAFVVPVEKAA